MSNYRSFDPQKIVDTTASLERRIGERFGESSLRKIAAELNQVAREAVVRAAAIREPIVSVRLGIWTLVIVIMGLVWFVAPRSKLDWHNFFQSSDFLQNFDAGLESFVLLAAALLSLVTVESRIKRSRALRAMHELRAIAHIIDMHQLTKDPERITRSGPATASSPERQMTPFELGRYLDYCSELLSLVNKIGAVYVQDFPDPTALAAADQLATLTNDLSQKIWQKIMILDIATGSPTATVAAATVQAITTDSAPLPEIDSPPQTNG
jgi:hypothetical protein